jgi:hypothetical protein
VYSPKIKVGRLPYLALLGASLLTHARMTKHTRSLAGRPEGQRADACADRVESAKMHCMLIFGSWMRPHGYFASGRYVEIFPFFCSTLLPFVWGAGDALSSKLWVTLQCWYVWLTEWVNMASILISRRLTNLRPNLHPSQHMQLELVEANLQLTLDRCKVTHCLVYAIWLSQQIWPVFCSPASQIRKSSDRS